MPCANARCRPNSCLEKIAIKLGEVAFVHVPQPIDAPSKIGLNYGRWATGKYFYSYVRGNPVSSVDPLGLRDVIVAVWTSQILSGSVGHVFVGEMNGAPITSQFPNPHGIEGANTTKTWLDTVAAEGRQPNYVYEVSVPNDTAFDASAAAARNTPRWYAFPDGNNSTNCSNAAADAMRAGGVKGVSSTGGVWPNWYNSNMQSALWFGSQVTQLPAAPW